MFRDHQGKPANFARISNELIEDRRLSADAKFVFLVFAKFAREDGPTYPSYRTIQEHCSGIGRTTISEAIKELVALGYLQPADKRPMQTVTYWLVPSPWRRIDALPASPEAGLQRAASQSQGETRPVLKRGGDQSQGGTLSRRLKKTYEIDAVERTETGTAEGMRALRSALSDALKPMP